MNKQTTVVILSSSDLNNTKILKGYSQKIEDFMKENIPENSLITIGSTKNFELIEYLQNKGYKIIRKIQGRSGLEKSNKKLIEDNDIVLFFNYESSFHMNAFFIYANSLDCKDIKVLEI